MRVEWCVSWIVRVELCVSCDERRSDGAGGGGEGGGGARDASLKTKTSHSDVGNTFVLFLNASSMDGLA